MTVPERFSDRTPPTPPDLAARPCWRVVRRRVFAEGTLGAWWALYESLPLAEARAVAARPAPSEAGAMDEILIEPQGTSADCRAAVEHWFVGEEGRGRRLPVLANPPAGGRMGARNDNWVAGWHMADEAHILLHLAGSAGVDARRLVAVASRCVEPVRRFLGGDVPDAVALAAMDEARRVGEGAIVDPVTLRTGLQPLGDWLAEEARRPLVGRIRPARAWALQAAHTLGHAASRVDDEEAQRDPEFGYLQGILTGSAVASAARAPEASSQRQRERDAWGRDLTARAHAEQVQRVRAAVPLQAVLRALCGGGPS